MYISALCAAISCVIGFPFKINSLKYQCISAIQGFFMSVGFYLLLLLWHSIAINVKNGQYLLFLHYGIIISFVIMIIDQVLSAIYGFIPASVVYDTVHMVITLLLAPSQFILSLHSTAKHALLLVTRLCAIFSLGYLMAFTANMLYHLKVWNYSVEAEVFRVVLLKISYVVRISVLLFVIDLRPKSDGYCKDKVAIEANNKKNTATLVQSICNNRAFHACAIMSSNIQPDVQPVLEDSICYNTTTISN
ncbi:hypothetical protein BDF19DRAFT_432372 [Syncephalis fuscata]|nr:hypothetical protein BDF19DRAFT_432372 [Syncephalis fuscata]